VSSVVAESDSRPRFEVYVDRSIVCAQRLPTLSKALRSASALIGCDPSVACAADLVAALRRNHVHIHWDS
jgi:hypothetical protein